MQFLGRPDPDDTLYWRMRAHAAHPPVTQEQLQARRALHVATLRAVLGKARRLRIAGNLANLEFWAAMTRAGNLRAEILGARA